MPKDQLKAAGPAEGSRKPSRPILKLNRPTRRRSTRRLTPEPPSMDQAERLKRQKAAALLDELRSINPEIWDADSPRPLAVGVHTQIYPLLAGVAMSRKSLRRFLAWWTGSEAYRHALTQPGARRYNLDGSPAGPVSGIHSSPTTNNCRRDAQN